MGHEGFRSNEILFLQEQNQQILESLERAESEREQAHEQIRACEERDASLQAELQAVRDKIGTLGQRLTQDKTEVVAKDDHVRVLGEQNRQMLMLLETEEQKTKTYAETIRQMDAKIRKLQRVTEEFDRVKAELEKQVSAAKSKCVDILAGVKSQRSINETLRATIQNTEAKTRVDIEALTQALQVVEQKNLDYLAKINKQETREQTLKAETETLKEEVETIRSEIDALRKQLEGDEDGRVSFERNRGQAELAIEALEVQADTLKKAVSTAERANEQLQEENRGAADRCRETSDKVYALMDSLRLNQVELRKQEAENGARDKKLVSLERQTSNLQAKIGMEVDAKVLAEQERKEAEQESSVLKKKNKKIEDAVTLAQQAQEKAEREIAEMNEKVSQLQTQNAYLASRIDGQEEEKNTMKAEIKKVSDKVSQVSAENSRLRESIDLYEEKIATTNHDKEQYSKELEYIKREDVLDELGRQRPILIQSTESDLLEKLQVNEFLYEAQQARNPVPPMIEKIAQLLAMLHEGQMRSDAYLGDLSKSNALVTALRTRNMQLFTKTQMFESFKTRALLKYVMNLVEGDQASDLHLDGLSFGPREINESILLLQRYEVTEQVFVVTLIDNGLDEDSVNILLQLIFSLPYLKVLDLRRNCFTNPAIKRIEEQVRTMEGVTGVIRTANQVINVHSGNQLRLTIDVSEQVDKDQVVREVDFTVPQELAATDADPFLGDSGTTSQMTLTKTAAGQRSPTKNLGPAAAAPAAQTAVPDPSSTELPKAAAAPPAPVLGGPPIGLGGPGNVQALNKKAAPAADAAKDKAPDPKKRQPKRAKAAPPPLLEYQPNLRVIDKWQAGGAIPVSASAAALLQGASGARPPSSAGSKRTSSVRADDQRHHPAETKLGSFERALSVPALRVALPRLSSHRG